jgi:hypothetical protein|nr:MAG TPA: hypothetical protein [Bacteriophage sp.]
MRRTELKNENVIYTGTAREILSLWKNLTERHMDDWSFILNTPKMNMNKNYGLYVDLVDGLDEPYNKPQLGILNASGVLEALNLI